MINIHAILAEKAKRYHNKTAIIFQDQSVNFHELYRIVVKWANALQILGIERGDKVGIYLPNGLEYVYSYLSSFCLGATVVPLDYMLKSDELISCLGHSETKILITLSKNDTNLQDIQKAVPSLKTIVITSNPTGETAPFIKSIADTLMGAVEHWNEISISENDPAMIMYTSGTTGSPKGILLNYRHLEDSPRAMEHFVDLTDQDVKLAAIPFSHIGGFIYIQNCIIFGITLVIMDRFNPMQFLKYVAQYRVTCFHIVPPMYTALLTLKHIDQFDLSSLRWVVVFGAPSSPEILERFHKYCPNARLLNGWGMTETCPPNTVTPLDSDNIASVGKPSALCQIRIVDEDGKQALSGETGEIIISGEIIMAGYYRDQELTAETIKDGWLYTGDWGRFDRDGFLYIVGRKKEMIKVAGQIVYAPEVEAAFYKHASVAEVAVIGIPDKLRGEAVMAFIVPHKDAQISPEELRYFSREHLAHFKVPQLIELRTELPKNRTGKIDKEILRKDVRIELGVI